MLCIIPVIDETKCDASDRRQIDLGDPMYTNIYTNMYTNMFSRSPQNTILLKILHYVLQNLL
jgi:hypothetical protein